MTKKILRALAPWREVFCMVRLSVRRFTAKRQCRSVVSPVATLLIYVLGIRHYPQFTTRSDTEMIHLFLKRKRQRLLERQLPPGFPRGGEIGLGDLLAHGRYAPLVLRALKEHQVQLVGFEPCLDKTQQARRALALTLNLLQVRKLSEAIGHAKCVLPLAEA